MLELKSWLLLPYTNYYFDYLYYTIIITLATFTIHQLLPGLVLVYTNNYLAYFYYTLHVTTTLTTSNIH